MEGAAGELVRKQLRKADEGNALAKSATFRMMPQEQWLSRCPARRSRNSCPTRSCAEPAKGSLRKLSPYTTISAGNIGTCPLSPHSPDEIGERTS